MSIQAQYFIPEEDTLREIGRMQVLHGHLDHSLRLSIKRILGISVDDPGYWNETRGMAKNLRDKVRGMLAEKCDNDDDRAVVLNKVLDDADGATELRNRALHSVWMKEPRGDPFLHDRDMASKSHVNYLPPSKSDLEALSARIQRIHRVLDGVTRDLQW